VWQIFKKNFFHIAASSDFPAVGRVTFFQEGSIAAALLKQFKDFMAEFNDSYNEFKDFMVKSNDSFKQSRDFMQEFTDCFKESGYF
jgi:hypothetical protein